MTAPAAKDDAVTQAVALTRDDMAILSPDDRALIAKRKAANIVAAQIAGTNWGKGLDTNVQRAVSDWGQRHGIDVTTEIHVLAGNIYLNAQFYINRLVDLVKFGRVLDFQQKFINPDPRLDDILKEVLPATASDDERAQLAAAQAAARHEKHERRTLRIIHNVPESATSAVLTTVTLVALPHTPFTGVKWAPRNDKDPIGAAYPQETALTRSARRALRLCVRHLPEVARYVDGAEDDAVTSIGAAIADSAAHGTAPAPATIGAGTEPRQLGAGPLTVEQVGAAGRGIPEAEYVTEARASTPAPTAAQRAAMANRPMPADPYDFGPPIDPPDPVEQGGQPAAPEPGPVSRDLFGGESPVEPVRSPAVPPGVDEDDWAIMSDDERAEAIAHAARGKRK